MAPVDDMAQRLRLYKYNKDTCRSAIRGEQVPYELGLPLIRRCLIRGIRYCDGFGEELRGVLPEFTRALNARSIMSNCIPEMHSNSEIPYCIWHPQSASEATLRELARRYPQMLYHVGRACAVAGHVSLYKDLDILPDVHIAEEARECGSIDIYNHIMSQPVRYDMMNDYLRTVAVVPSPGACLNGDTAVCRSLDIKQQFTSAEEPESFDENGDPLYLWGPYISEGFKKNTFDITEDMNIEEMSRSRVERPPPAPTSPLILDLLSAPLPSDLPTVDKDLLILMAAYYGNIERYSRLRRPELLPREHNCCVRGIYHNTMFALWWSRQNPSGSFEMNSINKAISARMIMNNVLHRMHPAKAQVFDDPYLIWYPSIAAESTYDELFRLRPTMGPQILRACVAGGYTDLFEKICAQLEPDEVVVEEATVAGGLFKEVIERRVADVGKIARIEDFEYWKRNSRRVMEIVSNSLEKDVHLTVFDDQLYNGLQCNAEEVEVLASLPEEWKEFPRNIDGVPTDLDYDAWPPKIADQQAE
ncbi:hypothetical protein MBLNU459_g7340t1 [Dothideomycetes sp. NU459]